LFFRATDGNLGTRTRTSKGQAASGEARPISRFFDTLEYRERDPERVPFPKYGRRTPRRPRLPRTGEGKAPGRRNPGEPGSVHRRDPGRGTPTCRGIQTPEARPRRPERDDAPIAGTSDGAGGTACRSSTLSGSQSREGMRRREAVRSRQCQALKGEPRERARLKHIGEIVPGARRRGGQEPRGRNMTRARQARERWLGTVGLRCWGNEPRESDGAGMLRRADARVRLWSGVQACGRLHCCP
jgi:hypothetical protein